MEQIRFFAMGKDLNNELFLYSYAIKDGLVIMAMIKFNEKKLKIQFGCVSGRGGAN